MTDAVSERRGGFTHYKLTDNPLPFVMAVYCFLKLIRYFSKKFTSVIENEYLHVHFDFFFTLNQTPHSPISLHERVITDTLAGYISVIKSSYFTFGTGSPCYSPRLGCSAASWPCSSSYASRLLGLPPL